MYAMELALVYQLKYSAGSWSASPDAATGHSTGSCRKQMQPSQSRAPSEPVAILERRLRRGMSSSAKGQTPVKYLDQQTKEDGVRAIEAPGRSPRNWEVKDPRFSLI